MLKTKFKGACSVQVRMLGWGLQGCAVHSHPLIKKSQPEKKRENPQGSHSNTFMCFHPQASDYKSTPKHRYLEYEIMTPYHRYSFTDLPQ